MTTLEIEPKVQEALQKEVGPELRRATIFQITSVEDKNFAIDWIRNLKTKLTILDERFRFTAAKDSAYGSYQAAMAVYKAFTDPFKKTDEVLRDKVRKFERDELIREQAEKNRIEAERREKERKAQERLNAKAEKAEENGNVEKAELFREQAETTTFMPEIPAPAADKNGTTSKLIWIARVTDVRLACKAIGEGKVPPTVIQFKDAELKKFAALFHDSKIEGIEFVQDVALTVRG